MSVLPFRLPDDPESRFALLERAAVAALEGAAGGVPPGRVASFRLWHYPPGGAWTTWVLIVPRGLDFSAGPGLVRELRWDGASDRMRIDLSLRRRVPLEPAIVRRTAALEGDVVRGIFRRASRHGLALRFARPAYAGGTLTEYGIEGYPERTAPERVEWAGPVPVGLGSIAAWHAATRRVFEAALEAEAT